METWPIYVACLVVLSTTVPGVTLNNLNTINMVDSCDRTINLQNMEGGAAFLKLAASHPSAPQWRCRVILTVPDDHQMMFKILSLDLAECCGNLALYGNSTQHTIATDICDSDPDQTFVTPGNTGIVTFTSSGLNDEFNIMVTDFRMASGNCTSTELMCANHRCIDRTLICNGLDNCGDGSACVEKKSVHEAMTDMESFWGEYQFFIIAFGLFFVFLFVACCLKLLRRTIKRSAAVHPQEENHASKSLTDRKMSTSPPHKIGISRSKSAPVV